jgi:hypothetical protein
MAHTTNSKRMDHVPFALDSDVEVAWMRNAVYDHRDYMRANVRGIDVDSFLKWDDLRAFVDSLAAGTVEIPWEHASTLGVAFQRAAEDAPGEQQHVAETLTARLYRAKGVALGLY